MPQIKVKGQTVQTGERQQTNGHTHTHTHGRYETYYSPCFAVDNSIHSNETISFIWIKQQKMQAVTAVRKIVFKFFLAL